MSTSTLGTRRARAAAGLLLAMPGAVYLYQGEELGLPEVLDMPDDARQDPVFASTDGAKKGRDGCRVPLPWTADPAGVVRLLAGDRSAGGARGCRSRTDWGRYAADGQDGDDGSMLELYRRLIARPPTHLLASTTPSSSTSTMTWSRMRRGPVLVVCNAGREPHRRRRRGRAPTPLLTTGARTPRAPSSRPTPRSWFAS